jgi:alkylation response protein AidB-like acyl-CoA dehydrogenase
MDLLLDEPQRIFADTAARLCADFGGPKRLRALRAAGSAMDEPAWRAAVDAGWLSMVVDEHHGGQGLGAFELALALEQMGRALMRLPLVEAGAAAATLSCAGAGGKALDDLVQGRHLIVPATAPPFWRFAGQAAGVRLDAHNTTLDGTIPFVTFAELSDSFLVAAEAGTTPALCIVPRGASGVSIAAMQHVDDSSSGNVSFANVAPTQVIATGDDARTLILRMQECMTLGVAAELVGLAAAALDVTLDYLKLRQQFGRPIGSFQALQHRAVDSFVDIELNRSLVYRVLAAYDAGVYETAMMSAAKARASRCALEVMREALQMHGAIGYTEEHDIGLYFKRAQVLAARYGNELSHSSRFSALTLDTDLAAAGGTS